MLLQHLPDHTAICFPRSISKSAANVAPSSQSAIFFLPWHQLLHCIPTLQKGLIVCLTRQIPVGPLHAMCAVFFCCRQLFPFVQKNHPSFASSIRKQFSSAPIFAASSRVRILSIPKSSRPFSVSSTFLVRFCTSALFSTDGCR